MELEEGALLAAHLVRAVGRREHGEHQPVDPDARLDHVRHVPLLVRVRVRARARVRLRVRVRARARARARVRVRGEGSLEREAVLIGFGLMLG